ncbi:Acyltransferase [Desulfocicer vacuolatum DSM 3385]|uniref:Acyltransferase n=1 Tax=Desulfocicer vacuolatum DSM 3385 TaxID=1121400 RepID=A0A1W2CAY6_9BACT|nr:1-acyl-sn-glycerol-3-phosphate acyltransferase [Desulfocicer vacuolatum]SMC82032.1 Acyltransferase [Desulfocicer vacuolatum DSM 3385]
MGSFLSFCGKSLYRFMGWTYDDLPDYWVKKSVVIGFPHTSNMDTVRALTYMQIGQINAKLLVKSDWFFWPMSVLLRRLGAIPVNRDKPRGFVGQIAKEFNTRDEFILALVPEGTRKNTCRIRTGFWSIAKTANVPIICWLLDNSCKRTRWLGKIMPGENLETDLLKIKEIYQSRGYAIPLGNMDQYSKVK